MKSKLLILSAVAWLLLSLPPFAIDSLDLTNLPLLQPDIAPQQSGVLNQLSLYRHREYRLEIRGFIPAISTSSPRQPIG
ncbi:MAG: hypothetical protein PHT37_01800 [Candidatus Cloacimonetes bacterium]|jgi:hypothetical protein|nr:hypothetical protein [Candidatus Cloacimonadota bacterium]MDD2423343.1 hypothetical protein [Candidatus Cloacimonadota bacterium]MDD3562693.1 hypothetical protein [Candidatus Cloacimonadota bacterium]MDD4276609.1 hypothetical protein [Candidatus Cloacimonadota bacterium]MDY0324647.1 hypothetical protein [Candidatus Cloacimonadaceae bacterium]